MLTDKPQMFGVKYFNVQFIIKLIRKPLSYLLNELGITREEIETAGEMPYSLFSCKGCK